MSETNKANTVAFHTKAVFEGDVENAFRIYGGAPYRQHNPLIEDGMEGLRKFVARLVADHPDAHGEIKRVFADGDYVILHSHWHGLSDSPRGEAVVDIYRSDMRRARPYRGENPAPGKDAHGDLDPTPGIREQPRPKAVIGNAIDTLPNEPWT